MKTKSLSILAVAALMASCNTPKDPMDAFVSDLMSQMTLQEKIGQLNQQVAGDIVTGGAVDTEVSALLQKGEIGSVLNVRGVEQTYQLQKIAVEQSRLGIPLIVGMDVIHGYETVFPIPLGLAATWDLEGIEKSAQIAAKEASANGVAWTFSPMVDICVDPRWGRQAEGAGEDPWLGSRIAEAMVHGYQGNDLKDENTIMACIKHFALYGAAEAGRDYNTVDMSHLRMYNQYFAPYKAAVEAGAGSVMTSFNIVDGIPATANKWLVTDVLRNEWGFDGFVVTDYASIAEMEQHGISDRQHNAVLALKAGTDMDMVARSFVETLEQSLKEGLVSQNDIDTACRRILEAKYKLGLFDDPYRYCNPERAKNSTYHAEDRAVARQLTAESFVLLKNDGNVLPLKKQGTVALIGPMAEARAEMQGTWCVAANPSQYSTIKESLERALNGKGKLLCAQGCNIYDEAVVNQQMTSNYGFQSIPVVNASKAKQEAMDIARKADVIVCAMGETSHMNGEGTSRADLEMPAEQRELLASLKTLGKPIVLLNFAGRATVLKWESENIPAIMQVWYGSECADAIADVLFGDVAPQGRLTVSMPQHTGQLPLYYNHLNTGRPVAESAVQYQTFASNYIDYRNTPLYPFGYGLTYTTFEYSDVTLNANEMAANGSVTASVTVTNTGDCDGTEVVQLYIRDLLGSVSRPVKELKGFERVALKKGESREVSFTITAEMLKFYNSELKYVAEPGDFAVLIGPNSADKALKSATFCLK